MQTKPETTAHEPHPWDSVEVGDSFFVSKNRAKPSSMRAQASVRNTDTDRRFKVSRVEDGVVITRTQ